MKEIGKKFKWMVRALNTIQMVIKNMKENKEHGQGIMIRADGRKLVGEWKCGNMDEKCIKYRSCGDKEYEGEMKNDQMHGKSSIIMMMVVNMKAILKMVKNLEKVFISIQMVAYYMMVIGKTVIWKVKAF
jgi:hypothetical protein